MTRFIAIRNKASGLLHAVPVDHIYCLCGSTKVRGMSRYHTANEGRVVFRWQGETDHMAKRCAQKYRTKVLGERN